MFTTTHILMKKLPDYIFYRVYECTYNNRKNVDVAVSNATYVIDIYRILFIESLFFLLEGIIKFDMSNIAFYYTEYRKLIVVVFLVLSIIWTYIIDKRYKRKVEKGWIKELRKKYHKEKYSISTLWIIIFPFIMILVVPIIYGTITGTGRFWVSTN